MIDDNLISYHHTCLSMDMQNIHLLINIHLYMDLHGLKCVLIIKKTWTEMWPFLHFRREEAMGPLKPTRLSSLPLHINGDAPFSVYMCGLAPHYYQSGSL